MDGALRDLMSAMRDKADLGANVASDRSAGLREDGPYRPFIVSDCTSVQLRQAGLWLRLHYQLYGER